MVKEVQYIFDIIRYVFQCGECPKLDETVDLKKVYEICDKHHLESIVACGLSKAPYKKELPQDVYNKFISSWKLALIVDTAQQNALKELSEELEKHEIDYMPLKGIYIKKLYPSSELRKMSDLDILLKTKDVEKISSLMKNIGYDYLEESDNQAVYQKKPFISIEIHNNLVNHGSRIAKYYNDVFSKANKESEYCYSMNWNDYYIYHLVHFFKHFTISGCGIRFIIDHFVLQRKLSDKMNRDYIDRELKKIGLYDFEITMNKLAEELFNGKRLSILDDEIIEYMLHSGLYGCRDNVNENTISLMQENVQLGKAKNWCRIVFMPLYDLRRMFAYIDKFPILLPIGWIHRWINVILFSRNRIEIVYKSNNVDSEMIKKRRRFMKNVGINDHYL